MFFLAALFDEGKPMKTLYYVMIADTEKTVAICDDRAIAIWILNNYPAECIMRTTITR